MQFEEPAGAAVPLLQAEHKPPGTEMVFTGQSVHNPPSLEDCPAAHAVQFADPCGELEPALQGWQELEPGVEKKPA